MSSLRLATLGGLVVVGGSAGGMVLADDRTQRQAHIALNFGDHLQKITNSGAKAGLVPVRCLLPALAVVGELSAVSRSLNAMLEVTTSLSVVRTYLRRRDSALLVGSYHCLRVSIDPRDI